MSQTNNGEKGFVDTKMEELEGEERIAERTGRRRGIQQIREIGVKQ